MFCFPSRGDRHCYIHPSWAIDFAKARGDAKGVRVPGTLRLAFEWQSWNPPFIHRTGEFYHSSSKILFNFTNFYHFFGACQNWTCSKTRSQEPHLECQVLQTVFSSWKHDASVAAGERKTEVLRWRTFIRKISGKPWLPPIKWEQWFFSTRSFLNGENDNFTDLKHHLFGGTLFSERSRWGSLTSGRPLQNKEPPKMGGVLRFPKILPQPGLRLFLFTLW